MAGAAIAFKRNAGSQCGVRDNRTGAIKAVMTIVMQAVVAGAAIAPDEQSMITGPWHRSGKPRH